MPTKKPPAGGRRGRLRSADAVAELAGRTSHASPPPVSAGRHFGPDYAPSLPPSSSRKGSRLPRTVVLGTARTPFAKIGGGLASLSAPKLGIAAGSAALERSGVEPKDVGYVVMGQVLQAGAGQIPSRQVSVGVGLGPGVGSETINKVCASGMRAATLADVLIRAGEHEVILAGGMESMSNAPYLLEKGRFGYTFGDGTLVDSMTSDGRSEEHTSELQSQFHLVCRL